MSVFLHKSYTFSGENLKLLQWKKKEIKLLIWWERRQRLELLNSRKQKWHELRVYFSLFPTLSLSWSRLRKHIYKSFQSKTVDGFNNDLILDRLYFRLRWNSFYFSCKNIIIFLSFPVSTHMCVCGGGKIVYNHWIWL